MENVKDFSARGEGYVWPCWAVAYVDDKILRAYAGRHEVEAASRIFSETSELRVQGLLTSDLVPIQSHLADRVDDQVEICRCSFSFCC